MNAMDGARDAYGRDPADVREMLSRSDQFLNQMAFRSMADYDPIATFQVDCFYFTFQGGLAQDVQYGFFQYAKTLDLTDQRAVVKLWLWLRQHGVDPKLKFRWNRSLPFLYNLGKIDAVWYMRRLMEIVPEDQVMSYDLASDQYALHP